MLPALVLLLVLGIAGFVVWSMVKDRRSAASASPRHATPEGIEGRARELRDQLDRQPFGEALARDVWRKLMAAETNTGVIYDYHREFCGQGLIRTADGVKLCDVEDGGARFSRAIAAWSDEAAFVAFFARQSDYSCSGWDKDEAVFFTSDSWYRNNQRLTRAVLERYLSTGR
jgi:hypothetical protein